MAVDKPLFSVLLPTHSRSDVIGYALKSVLAQTEQSFEILVVGDGAEEGTFTAIDAFADSRIRWFDFPKAEGFGYANRNRALLQAKGRYIAHMSDDDLILPTHLASLREALDSGAKIACTRAIGVSSDGIACPLVTNLSLKDELEEFKTKANCLPSTCFAYRLDALDEIAPWPENGRGGGDWVVWRKVMTANPMFPLIALPKFSALHFTAKRKNLRSNPGKMAALLKLADSSDWWPEFMSPEIKDGTNEQSVWSDIISTSDGVELLERNTAIINDRLALMYLKSLLPRRKRSSVSLFLSRLKKP